MFEVWVPLIFGQLRIQLFCVMKHFAQSVEETNVGFQIGLYHVVFARGAYPAAPYRLPHARILAIFYVIIFLTFSPACHSRQLTFSHLKEGIVLYKPPN
jgi:hypothetical protein